MDSSCPREGGAMKRVILKVGVALVLSATGVIFARFVSWKEDNEVTSSARKPESSPSPSRRKDGQEEEEKESLVDHQKQEILSLNLRLEELQKKEHEMELRFACYCFLKDKEVRLVERKSMLVLERSQLDFFHREVSAMEEELKRGQDLVIVYSKLVGEIQELRSKNRLLEGEAKKLRIRVKQLHRVVNQKSRKSVKKLLKCIHELGKKNNFVKELEGQVKGLKANLDLLQEEKEVYMKSSEMVSVEEHRRVLEENEDLNTEVSYLRWINSCLRKELMRNGTKYDGALALTVVADGHHEWGKKLMKNLKRCVGGHSGTVEPDEEGMFHSRRSCSSV
ncbi:hypothetical protein IGI04_010464 [Brassica rapa subsp. trilocularis]|uniref:Uncharacterized protein n=1 Tax=Brassica rapa subsp. trilocularis TaxID=1813537 RepID=A0ABQ7N0B4_BRACM|nr:hypothetical protein IGI04_010464 [Brassica rapa subsp. trilocularis]